MNNVNHHLLSEAGKVRRDAILNSATAAMERHYRMRRRKRAVAASALCVIVCGAFLVSQFALFSSTATIKTAGNTNGENNQSASQTPSAPGVPAVTWRIVQSDPTAVQRYAARTRARVDYLTDVELAQTLESIDRPAGVIAIGGEVRLTRNVVDETAPAVSDSPESPL